MNRAQYLLEQARQLWAAPWTGDFSADLARYAEAMRLARECFAIVAAIKLPTDGKPATGISN